MVNGEASRLRQAARFSAMIPAAQIRVEQGRGAKMRVVIAEFKQETNTFVPYLTTMEQFRAWHLWEREEIIPNFRGNNAEVAGFIDVLEEAGIEPVPTIAAMAMSGGPVEQATFEALLGRLLHLDRGGAPLRRRAAGAAWRDGDRRAGRSGRRDHRRRARIDRPGYPPGRVDGPARQSHAQMRRAG